MPQKRVKGGPHCIIIGAGIVGSSCAWHLVSKGARVTLIDSEWPIQGASAGNAGCICKSSLFPFSHPGAIRKVPGWLLDSDGPMHIRWTHLLQSMPWLYRFWRAGNANRVREIVRAQATLMNHVLDDYDDILAATGNENLRESRGMILLYDTEREFTQDAWKYESREHLGFPWQRLTGDELKSLEPGIRLGEGVAVFEPEWQHLLDPGLTTRRIAEAAIERGVTWIKDRVLAVSHQAQGVAVVTDSGTSLKADRLIIAGGVWSGALTRQLGFIVPLIAKRGYHSMIRKTNLELRHPIMSASRHVLLTPMHAGVRVSGTAEFAGLDTKPDYRRVKSLIKHARYYVPDLGGEEATQWMGQRPMLPDSLPVIGRLPGQENVLCAFGHGHYGLTQGPTTGRIISELVFGQDPGIDLRPFSINRF